MINKELLSKIGNECVSDHILLLNAGAIGFSFADIESMLKILVLFLSAVYTAIKIYQMCKKHGEKKD